MTTQSVAQEGGGTEAIPVSLNVFLPLAEAWGLTTDEQMRLLGSPPRSTFFKWKKDGGSLPRDTVERISHLLAIWKALQIVFVEKERSLDWIRRPNDYFGDASALEMMLESGNFSDIVSVRNYLDAQRGG